MENFIWAIFEDYNTERASQSSESYSTSQSTIVYFFWDRTVH